MLEIKNLFYKDILKDINITIEDGSFTLLAGKNGSGKSCLLRCIQGLYKYKGEVIYHNKDTVVSAKEKNWDITGLVFQDAQMQIVGQTVAKDLAFGLEMKHYDKELIKAKVQESLKSFSIENLKDRAPSSLSGGEKRKVAIADIMIMKPKVLLLDEPFANLDYDGVKNILKLIVSLNKEGHTIFLVTHEIEKVLALADNLIILEDGKILKQGLVKDLYDKVPWEKVGLRVKGPLETQSWLEE
ncbi:MAG: ABC transporter ATP-binding protein [Sphaerochaetaceae bacterium]